MNIFLQIGRYAIFIQHVFAKPDKPRIYLQQIVKEMENYGLNSIGIVSIISVFMGAVITIQTATNMANPLLPKYLIGLAARDSQILEFSSTIVSLILAGKVGSSFASELGTMRVTEQIDALEIMGVNSASYLVFPKVVAAVFMSPFLYILSVFIGIFGGWLAGVASGVVTSSEFFYGIQYDLKPFYITYSLIKSFVFAFIIASVSSFYGYYTTGGALDVGKSSTQAVVYSMILILLFNFLISYFLLL